MPDIAGVLPVVSTPFDSDWGLDRDALRREVDWVMGHGADGLTVGMVSEVLRLTLTERMELCDELVASLDGRGVLITSVGAESTDQALRLVRHAVGSGVDAMMANPPLTVGSLSSEQLLTHYGALADAAGDTPLIVQDASGYIGSAVSLETLAELYRRYGGTKVQFKPEAQPLGARLTRLLELTDGGARVFEGIGGLALVDNYQRGVVGSMPATDLIWAVVPLWRSLVAGDFDTAYDIHAGLAAVLSLVGNLDSYVAMEKHLLVRQGVLPHPRQRQPVSFSLDPQTRTELDRLTDRLAAIVGHALPPTH